MELLAKIKKDRMIARKDKDAVKTKLLTTLVGEAETIIKNGKKYSTEDLLIKFRKGIEETLAVTFSADIAEELKIINSYLPSMLTDDELKDIIAGFPSNASLGQIMGYLSTEYRGRFDGKKAKELAENL